MLLLRMPPRQQCRAIPREMSPAFPASRTQRIKPSDLGAAMDNPQYIASSGPFSLYNVPILARSASSNRGRFRAPGIWPCANSEGERTSMSGISARRPGSSVMSISRINGSGAETKVRSEKFKALRSGTGCLSKQRGCEMQAMRRHLHPAGYGAFKFRFHPLIFVQVSGQWCNWQHVGFWFRRVQVRSLVGQRFQASGAAWFRRFSIILLSLASQNLTQWLPMM